LIVLALALGGFTVFAGAKALAAQRQPIYSGGEGLIGRVATVKTAFGAGETGSVFVQGEWWNARLNEGTLAAGEQVQVIGRDGFTLIVARIT
jgi:membrane-bound serine protease (ClpP class)